MTTAMTMAVSTTAIATAEEMAVASLAATTVVSGQQRLLMRSRSSDDGGRDGRSTWGTPREELPSEPAEASAACLGAKASALRCWRDQTEVPAIVAGQMHLLRRHMERRPTGRQQGNPNWEKAREKEEEEEEVVVVVVVVRSLGLASLLLLLLPPPCCGDRAPRTR